MQQNRVIIKTSYLLVKLNKLIKKNNLLNGIVIKLKQGLNCFMIINFISDNTKKIKKIS